LSKYAARFSGHQTFPLRYGWLYKYYQTSSCDNLKKLTTDDLMVEWGVGKNMVDALKYWADRVGVTSEINGICEYKAIHQNDAHLDNINSVWLIHWLLCRDVQDLTAYRIFFNFYNGSTVDKNTFMLFIKELFESRKFESSTKKVGVLQLSTENTLSKDISTFFLTYSSRKAGKVSEDSFSSPLSELGLIKQFDKQKYLSELEERTTLSNAVFVYALVDYFERQNPEDKQVTTVSFESFLMGEGSPARIFRMSQAEVELRLEKAGELTGNKIGWTDTQGLRQIQIKDSAVFDDKRALLNNIYK
jgi:hypothetical protein